MRRYRRILIIVFGVQLSIFAITWLLLVPSFFGRVQGDGWTAELPRYWLGGSFREGPWAGLDASLTADLRVASAPLGRDVQAALDEAAEALHPRPVETVNLPNDQGRFLLSGRGKQWRATLLLPAPGRLFRVECEQTHGNAAEPVQSIARIGASLRLDDGSTTAWSAPAQDALSTSIGSAIDRHLASAGRMMPPLLLFLLALGIGLRAHGYYSGRVPKQESLVPPVLLTEANVYLVSKRPWHYRGTLGSIVLDGAGLHAHAMGRQIAHIPNERLESIRRAPGRDRDKGFEFDMGNGVLRFFPKDPRRWASVLGIPG